MELEYTYADYAADKAIELIGIDSPSGYTERAAQWVQESFEMLGFMAERTQKGGVLVTVKGGSEDGLLLGTRGYTGRHGSRGKVKRQAAQFYQSFPWRIAWFCNVRHPAQPCDPIP